MIPKYAYALPVLLITLCCVSSDPFRHNLQANIDRNVLVVVPEMGTCAGVIVRTGYVITAKHCVGPTMYVDGQPATVSAVSKEHDVVLLVAKTKEVSDVGFNDAPQIGEAVYSVVNVAGLKSVVSRSHVIGFLGGTVLTENIACPGISGGGYYDESGRLIGIGSQYRVHQSEDFVTTGNISIAVDAAIVRALLPTEVMELVQ